MQEMQVQSQNWEDPLEKEIATYSSILAWEILWIEEPGSPWSCRVRHDLATKQQQPLKERGFPSGSVVKSPPAVVNGMDDLHPSLGWEDSLEKEMATHLKCLPEKSHGQPRWATVLRVAKSQIWLSDRAHMHAGALKRGGISNPAALTPPQADFPEGTASAKAPFTWVRIWFLHLSRYPDTSTWY